jgi:hypothetical protein
MTIEHGIPYAFKQEQGKLGTHDFSADTIKIALYGSSASLTLAATTAYTASGEFSGSGYSAGGQTLSLASGFPKMNTAAQGGVPAGAMLLFDFDDVTFSSITGTARGAMIYNSSRSNKVVALLDFGNAITKASEDLVITWPTPDVSNCIIRAV